MLHDMVTMNLGLNEEALQKLKAKAEQTGKPVEELITELVLGSLESDERYRAAVREGIADADAGKLVDFDEAMDRVTAKLTRMKAGR